MTWVTLHGAQVEELNGHNQEVASLNGFIHQKVPLRQDKGRKSS